MDAYTSWCGPCKWMAKEIFTNDTVADFFNKNFVNAKIDMEKGEGPEIAKMYKVMCYPNLLFIDGDGKLVHRGAGGQPAQQFIELAENASNPLKRYSHYADEYASKKNNSAFLVEYINATAGTCLPTNELLADYFKSQKEENLTNRVNWNMIRDFCEDYKSKEFTYLLKNADVYRKLYTTDSVNSKIKNVIINAGYGAIYRKESPDGNDYIEFTTEITQEMKSYNFQGMDEVLFILDMAAAEKKGDWQKYANIFVEKGDKYLKSPDEKNGVAWNLYEKSDDKNALEKAAQIMAVVVKESPDYACCDTYAAVLFKLKKKSEAKAAAIKAIELAKKEGLDVEGYQGTVDLLEKIEKL
jgi:thiol-disulfide isomerase/thioredoxin